MTGAAGVAVWLGNLQLPAGQPVWLDSRQADTITLRFPQEMERERTVVALQIASRLPAGTTFHWSDGQTLMLRLPPGSGLMEIDGQGAVTADGKAAGVRERFYLFRPYLVELSLFRLADLSAGRTRPARTWHLEGDPFSETFAVLPERELALVARWNHWNNGHPTRAPLLAELGRLTSTPLGLPADSYQQIGWLPDGRFLLAGEHLWAGFPDKGAERLAEGLFWAVAVAPSGRLAALVDNVGVQILDLTHGWLDRLRVTFRPPGHGSIRLAFSPDSSLLAGSDFAPDGPRILVVDLATERVVREIPGHIPAAWLVTGEILSSAQPALLIAGDGATRTIPGDYARPSPDGRYLLLREGLQDFVWEVATGRRIELPHQQGWSWAPGGDLIHQSDNRPPK